MPITVPNLDDLTWAELTDEARSLIPAWSPEWTNHNASDPGITLTELFAYVFEMLIYRLNRVNDDNTRKFLELINGPSWKSSSSLQQEIHKTVLAMRGARRAVTTRDFEILTLAANAHLKLPQGERVARVTCVAERNFEDEVPEAHSREAPGHVSIVVVSTNPDGASNELLRRIRLALEPARLLTTRLHVVRPHFVKLGVRLTLVAERNAPLDELKTRPVRHLTSFFDPLKGGFDGTGWPFGRHVYVSELYQLLDGFQGVDHVKKSKNPRTSEEIDELVVEPSEAYRLKWNASRELEAAELYSNELVRARIDPAEIAVVSPTL